MRLWNPSETNDNTAIAAHCIDRYTALQAIALIRIKITFDLVLLLAPDVHGILTCQQL